MVGTSGSRLERFGPVYASTRRRPALICGAVEVPDIIAATSPDTVALVAGAPPLYGICTSAIPARPFSRSIVRWCWLPLPPEAYWSGGSARFAYSMNSARLCTGSCGFTTRKKPFDTRLATGTRSLNGSNGMCSYRCGLIAIRLSMPRSSVYPSGAALATASPATTPLPPTRFSTTTGWPSVSLRRAAMRRPTRSGPPPGGIGTSKRTGFEGYCAAATDAKRATVTARIPLRTRGIAGRSDSIEIVLPHEQVALAGLDRGVFHAQLPGEFLHRAPAGVRVLDVGLGVQLEELELVLRQPEQLPPAQPLDAEPAALSEQPAAVARHIDALGAGVGDDAFEPVAVRHQTFPRRPRKLGRRQRPRVLQLAPLQADAQAEVLEDLPVRPAAAVLVVGDHLLAAGLDDAQASVPVTAIRCHFELEHGVALPRVKPMLQREHARPALGHRLVEPRAARDERVDHLVHSGDNAHDRNTISDTANTTSAPAARKRSVVSDTSGRSGSLDAAAA